MSGWNLPRAVRLPAWALLAAALAAGTLLRLPALTDGLDHDEAYTWEAFASRSYSTVTGHYPVPNNHILHSILVRGASQLLGTSEPVLRLPALVAGVLGIAAVWWLAASIGAAWAPPALAAWALALMPVHVGYSQVARGYTLLVLLAAVAGGALLRAQRSAGGRGWWAVYGVAAFLAMYTQPSAALLIAALGGWSVWHASRSTDRTLLGSTLTAHALVAAACAWAYGPLLSRVLAAGRAWGIDLHAGGAGAITGLVWDVGALLSGGGPLLLAAAGGLVVVLRLAGISRWLAASLVAVPFAVPLVHGIAPQPRGYLFLLPWVVVAAAVGLRWLAAWRRVQAVAAAVVLVPLGAVSVSGALTHESEPRWRELGRRLTDRSPRGELLVAPSLMDVEVYHYASGAIQRGVVTTLMDGHCRSLLLAVNRADARFDLPAYQLTSETTEERRALALDPAGFEVVYEDGPRAILRLLGEGQSMLPDTWQWNAHPEEVTAIRFGAAGPAVTERPGLAVANDSRRGFRIYSQARFRPPADGLAVLVAARSDPTSEVSLYAADPQRAQGEAERVAESHMLLTAAKPVRAVGRDQRFWYLEAFVLPVQGGGEYGVYIRGSQAPRQDFADIHVFHFPWP